MKISRASIVCALEVLLGSDKNRVVTWFLSDKERIRIARKKYKCNKGFDSRYPIEVVINIGKLNAREKVFIAKAHKDGKNPKFWISKVIK